MYLDKSCRSRRPTDSLFCQLAFGIDGKIDDAVLHLDSVKRPPQVPALALGTILFIGVFVVILAVVKLIAFSGVAEDLRHTAGRNQGIYAADAHLAILDVDRDNGFPSEHSR